MRKPCGLASPADIIGKTDYDMPWAETEADNYRADDRRVMDSGEAKLGIIETQVRADGSKIWIETNKLPIRNLNGEVIGILGTYQDITDHKAAEAQVQRQSQQLEQANQQLEEHSQTLEQRVEERTQELSQALTNLQSTQTELIQSEKMAALGQLTASVAHEINTPLGVIRAAITNIVAASNFSVQQLPKLIQSLSPQQQAEFLALVNAAIQNSHTLSTREERQLRQQLQIELADQGIADANSIASQLSQMQVGLNLHLYQSILHDQNCDEILQVASKLVLQHLSITSIQQEVDRAAKIVFALKAYSHQSRGNQKSLGQITDGIEVALTLYHNRLKQGIEVIRNYRKVPDILCDPDELTQVWVNIIDNAIYAMKQQGTLQIAVTQQGENVVVEVMDSGCGIPGDLQVQVFELFFTTKPRGEGSGLGLDIVQQIVRRHDGTIQVYSQPGRTTFAVSFPLSAGR